MKLKRRKELKNAVLSHIINTILGELRDWDNLKMWINFGLTEEEEDIAEDMFRKEAERLLNKIS